MAPWLELQVLQKTGNMVRAGDKRQIYIERGISYF